MHANILFIYTVKLNIYFIAYTTKKSQSQVAANFFIIKINFLNVFRSKRTYGLVADGFDFDEV